MRSSLSRLVGGAARQSAPALEVAHATCSRLDVRPWHGDLRSRVDLCLDTLDARLRWLDEVARDGGAAFRSAPDPTAGCTG